MPAPLCAPPAAGGGFSDDDDAGDGAAGGADFGGWGDIDFGNEGGGGDSAEDSALAGTELLSAPRRVEKVEVNYSKAAKQVGAVSLCSDAAQWAGGVIRSPKVAQRPLAAGKQAQGVLTKESGPYPGWPLACPPLPAGGCEGAEGDPLARRAPSAAAQRQAARCGAILPGGWGGHAVHAVRAAGCCGWRGLSIPSMHCSCRHLAARTTLLSQPTWSGAV